VGQGFIAATFRGTTFQVPLDVDSWPVGLIRRCRGMQSGQVVANPSVVIAALKVLLGQQWPDFVAVASKRKHLVEASNVFAAAVGIGGDVPSDVAFGGIPRLLLTIDTWPDKVESDLNRFWQLDYQHRFLFEAGRRRLTLRKIHTRLSNLPTDSAVAIAMNGGKLHKSGTELVLMDLFEAQTGRRHPSRPMSAAEIAAREAEKAAEDKARADYQKRMAKQDFRKTGLELARANAQEGNHAQAAS
jgi:uncharacterized protein YdaU (DUF1376 family)